MTARIKKSMVCAIAAAAVVIGSAISIAVSNAQTAYAENEAVSVPITEPEVNEGKYYLNGNPDSCYFNVVDNTLQLVITDDADMHELFDEMASMNPAFANVFVFDNWYSDEKEYWVSPKEFMINVLPYGVQIGWDVYYSELDGSMSSYVCADYVDENCFKYNMCTFSRVSLSATESVINE